MISKVRGANRNFSSRMWVVAEAWERLLLLSPSPSASDGSVERSACCALRHTKSSVRLLHFDCPKHTSGEGQECVRVICTCVRIVSGRPLRAVALSCWRRTPLGERTQSMQTMVRIVLLFPSVLSLSFCENRKHLDFILFYFFCDFGFS